MPVLRYSNTAVAMRLLEQQELFTKEDDKA